MNKASNTNKSAPWPWAQSFINRVLHRPSKARKRSAFCSWPRTAKSASEETSGRCTQRASKLSRKNSSTNILKHQGVRHGSLILPPTCISGTTVHNPFWLDGLFTYSSCNTFALGFQAATAAVPCKPKPAGPELKI